MSIYTVQLCRMQYASDKPTTQMVSCKSNLQLAYTTRCRGILKHVLKPTTVIVTGNFKSCVTKSHVIIG